MRGVVAMSADIRLGNRQVPTMKPNRLIAIALSAALVLALSSVAEACPGCADAQAGQGADRANIVRGYFWSIVFMMSMPFMLIGGFGTYCYVQFKKLKAGAEPSPVPADSTMEAEPQHEPVLTAAP
jgi:heme/copper-type cytochrome/quinol oxidase subunit 2